MALGNLLELLEACLSAGAAPPNLQDTEYTKSLPTPLRPNNFRL